MSDFKIAIIGAGPAGCLLARLLHLANISVTIFEGEKTPDFRSQGGTLDLHTDSGLAAMKKAELYDKFLEFARFDAEAFTLANKKMQKYIRFGGTDEKTSRGRPEIDRAQLRELLTHSVPEGSIKWGYRLRSVDENLKLHFDHGTEEGFDLIVGADGAFSKVRPLLSSTVPYYSGISGYTINISNAKETQPEVYKLVNRGSTFAMGDHMFVGAQQMGDGSINSAWWRRTDEGTPTYKLDESQAQAMKKEMQKSLSDWSPKLVDFMLQGDDNTAVYRPLYMLPVGHSWEHRPGVTLIGDAAHLMTPFAGEGVNLAFSDSVKLAEAIIKANEAKTSEGDNVTTLSKQVEIFEKDMFTRATKVQSFTNDMMHATFFMLGPEYIRFRTYVLRAISDDMSSIAYPFVASLMYVYFFVMSFIY